MFSQGDLEEERRTGGYGGQPRAREAVGCVAPPTSEGRRCRQSDPPGMGAFVKGWTEELRMNSAPTTGECF